MTTHTHTHTHTQHTHTHTAHTPVVVHGLRGGPAHGEGRGVTGAELLALKKPGKSEVTDLAHVVLAHQDVAGSKVAMDKVLGFKVRLSRSCVSVCV